MSAVKMVIKILHKLKNICLGTFRNIFQIRPKYYNKRYNICKECSELRHAKGFGDYCNICGCIIKSKISVNSEKCDLNKW